MTEQSKIQNENAGGQGVTRCNVSDEREEVRRRNLELGLPALV